MDSGTQALILGIAGLITTVATGWLGLFYTAQSRRAAVRELLYAKQLDMVSDGMKLVGRMRTLLNLLLNFGGESFKEQAREDIGKVVREFSELVDRATALLPTELWVEFRNLNFLVVDALVAYDENSSAGQLKEEFVVHSTKTALLARVFLAVDELSTESAILFKTKASTESVAALKASELITRARKGKGPKTKYLVSRDASLNRGGVSCLAPERSGGARVGAGYIKRETCRRARLIFPDFL